MRSAFQEGRPGVEVSSEARMNADLHECSSSRGGCWSSLMDILGNKPHRCGASLNGKLKEERSQLSFVAKMLSTESRASLGERILM